MTIRKLRNEEIDLITWMIKDTVEGPGIIKKLDEILVKEMNDGGMGSLRVFVKGDDNRLYSRDLANVDLWDIDNIPLFISVNLDTNGDFFELDIFKGDSSPLKRFPRIPK